MKQVPVITLGIAGLCLSIAALFGYASLSTTYIQSAVLDGQWWRLLSAHFSHSDIAHMAWNTIALMMIGGLLELRIGKAIMGVYVMGMLSVNLYLLAEPNLVAYCGLSGVLNTVLVAFLATLLQDRKTRWLGLLTAGLALAKIFTEMGLEQSLFTHTTWPGVPLAHLFGFMGGLAWMMFSFKPTRGFNSPLLGARF